MGDDHVMLGLVAGALTGVPGISHRFFGRWGGTSPAPVRGLNTSFTVADAPARVEENLARVRFQVGVGRRRLFAPKQVHGTRVLVLDGPEDPDVIAEEEADALFSTAPDLALGIRTADCAPVLFAAADGRAVAAAHAGWRGAVGGVLQATLSCFEEVGVPPGEVVCAVGPCIGVDAFEVGPEVIEAASAACDLDGLVRAGREDRSHLDLGGLCARLLERAGVRAVERVPGCTATETERFFSHRAEHGKTGRQMSAIARTDAPVIDAATFA